MILFLIKTECPLMLCFFNIPLCTKTLYETKHWAKWNLLHTSPAQCSLLHCSLMDLTLANSLSVIYDQTAPEPGIYYPLLLSVRQHYITLHCSSQFAEQQCTTRKKYAVKSSLTYAKHQVPLLFQNLFAANVFSHFQVC